MRLRAVSCTAICAVTILSASAAFAAPHITGVAGIAYDTPDLNAARAYYEGFLGFQELGVLKNPDGSEHAILVKINDHQYIEFIQEPNTTHHGFLHGAIFATDDADGLRKELATKGFKVPEKVTKNASGNLAFEMQDPSGFNLEIVQFVPGSLTAKTKGKLMPANRISDHIDHIGLLVDDRDDSTKFYADAFGFVKEGDGSKMAIGSGPDRFELGVDRKNRNIDRYHVKDHICLSVPDVPKVTALLNAKPEAKTYRAIESHQLPNGKNVDELYGPDGNRIELMEPPKDGAAAAAE